MVESGVSISEKDATGSEPIHDIVAVAGTQVEMVRWLIDCGADKNRNRGRQTSRR